MKTASKPASSINLADRASYAPADQIRHYVAIWNFLVGVRAGTAPFLAGVLIPLLGVRAIFAIAAAGTFTGALLMRTAVRRALASRA